MSKGVVQHNKDISTKITQSVRKVIHWVSAIWEGWMSQGVGELVSSGMLHTLMSTHSLMWESTTTAGILRASLVVSGASPLTHIRDGSTALFHHVMQHTTVKKAIRWVSVTSES